MKYSRFRLDTTDLCSKVMVTTVHNLYELRELKYNGYF